jgi:hypothetical protein
MAQTTWNTGDPFNYVEIVTQAHAVARGGAQKNFYNIYHFRRTTTVNVLSKAHIESAFQTAIMTPVLAALDVDYVQEQTSIRFFEDPLNAQTFFAETGVGGVSGDRLPDFNAAVVQLHAGIRGKVGRGSKHYGPIAESSTTGDDLTSGAVTLVTAIGTAIIAGFTDSDGNVWVPGMKAAARVGKPYHYVLPLPTITGWTDIVSFVVNKSLGTMRRRKIRTVT